MEIKQIVLASRPIGIPSAENFRMEKAELPDPEEGEVLLQSWYFSVDPYMRGRMSAAKSYAASYETDKPVRGGVVAKVIKSRSSLFEAGDSVTGNLPWATYAVENEGKITKVDTKKYSPGYYLGVLGMPGYTAFIGMNDICNPVAGDTAVISGAAGAVGLIAGQIAAIKGCRVIGIAGTDEKCHELKNHFGFNEALNYKTSKSLRKELAQLCPEGVDVYFDNVGGEITESVASNLDFHARIALCGQISQYNNTKPYIGYSILPHLLTRSVMMQGFIVSNYSNRFPEAMASLSGWLDAGKIKFTETVVDGFENLPEAFLGLFSGKNLGKMLVRVN